MSDFRRHSTLGGGARQKVKIEYSIRIKEIAGLPKSTTGALFISWKRGSKKENSGETKHVPVKDQKADFDYEKGKKPTTLGKLAIDLAEFANSKTERIRTFQIKEKKTPVANITLSFKTTWLKMDGKTLVRADQAEVSGKQKVEIDGNDYYLQTEDELSIDETDQKSGGGNDSDEESVDFESDSDTGAIPKSPNSKRMSITPEGTAGASVSSLLPKAAPSTPTQPSVSASPSPSPSPSPAPNSTSPTPAIQVTSPSDEDPKVKKYKKKLKTARKEVEDLRVEVAKKDELVKAVQQGSAASAESAAQLVVLQKKEQQSQETEAKLRAELEEANKQAADARAEVEASRKGGDEANQLKDAKIKQLEEALQTRESDARSAETKQREVEQALEAARQDNKGRADLESKISALEEEGKNAEKEYEHKLDEKEKRIKELENDLQGEKSRSAERGSQEGNAIQELQKSLEEERQTAQEWESKYKQADQAARANDEKLNEFEKQLTTEKEGSAAEIARLGLLVVALQKDKDDKVQLESELKLAKEEHESTVESLRAKVESLEEQIRDSVDARAGEATAEIELLKNDLSTAEDRAIQAERKAEGLQKRINDSEQETSNAKKKLEEEVQRLQKRTKELEMQLASESGKDNELVADLQARAADLETQLNDAVSSSDSQAKQIAELNSSIQELEEEKEKESASKEKEKETRKQLEEKVEDLKGQIAALESELEGGSGQQDLIVVLQTKNKEAEDEISKLKQQVEEAESTVQDKERELEQARDSSNKGTADEGQIQELEDDLKKYKKKAKKAEEQALDLERQLDEAKLQLEQHQQNGGNEDSEVKYIELDKKYRAVKSRIDELDDEADRLRKREVVLTELNETSERRIEELETELKSSKQHATTNGDSARGEEAAELQKELDEVMAETAKLKVRVRELEEEAAKKQSKSLAGSGAVAAGGSEEATRLLRELEEHRKVEKAIYWDEIGFTPADVSKTATSVWQLLAATRELDAEDQPADQPLTSLAQKVITALDKSFRRSSGDNKQIAYWLSCTCSLLHFIHQRDDIPPSADPVLQGVQVNPEQFVNGPAHAEQFARALQDHVLNIYGQLAVNFQEHIQKLIIPAFLHEDQAVMDANQKVPARASSHAVISSPPSSPLSPHHSSSSSASIPSLTLLTNTLSSVHTLLREAKCPAAVVRQFFHQLLHFISGCVLNALLYGKEVSTATHGLRIKLAVSRIDEWLAKQDNDIAGTGERLNLLRDTANVLVLDKSLFLDADTITSIFHTLNLVQVRKLLDLFQPDAVSPAGVPAGVRQMMDTYWGYSPHNMPLLVDVTALVVVI